MPWIQPEPAPTAHPCLTGGSMELARVLTADENTPRAQWGSWENGGKRKRKPNARAGGPFGLSACLDVGLGGSLSVLAWNMESPRADEEGPRRAHHTRIITTSNVSGLLVGDGTSIAHLEFCAVIAGIGVGRVLHPGSLSPGKEASGRRPVPSPWDGYCETRVQISSRHSSQGGRKVEEGPDGQIMGL